MADLQRELDQLHQALANGFEGIHDRLDALNGRTRTAEQKIAVLEDRGSRDVAARATGGLALGLGVLVEIAKQVWGHK